MNVTTVDQNETLFFDSVSSQWWDPNGPILTLQKACDLIFKYLVKELPAKSLNILDVGCGGGLLSEPLTRHGHSVTGIDVNHNLIEVAKRHAQLDPSLVNLTYKHESVEEHAIHNAEKYDVVVLNFVLQHVINHEVLLKSCVENLKPGGSIFITSAAKTFSSWIRVVIAPELIFGYIPYGSHNWHNFFSAKDVDNILRKNKCTINKTKGIYYNVFRKEWDWWDNVDGGFYLLYANKVDDKMKSLS